DKLVTGVQTCALPIYARLQGPPVLILYNPPSSARRKPVMPLSLLALGAVLEGRHDYTIVDANLDRNALTTIDALVRDGADTLARSEERRVGNECRSRW